MITDIARRVLDADSGEGSTVVGDDTRVGHDIRADVGITTWDSERPLIDFCLCSGADGSGGCEGW